MKVYRVVNKDEKELLKSNPREIYPWGKTIFSKNQIDQGKYFFIDFLDAVKYCAMYFKIIDSFNIYTFEISDNLIIGNTGVGYYSSSNNVLCENYLYFALELLIPYIKLKEVLSTKNFINKYDIESIEFRNALELIQINGVIPNYQNIIPIILKIFKYKYKNEYPNDRPFISLLRDELCLTNIEEQQIYDCFIYASKEAFTDLNIGDKLRLLIDKK